MVVGFPGSHRSVWGVHAAFKVAKTEQGGLPWGDFFAGQAWLGAEHNDIVASSAVVSPSSAWVFNRFTPLRRQTIKNGVEQGHWTQSNRLGMKDLWPSVSRLLAPDQARVKTVNNPDPDSFRPQNQRSRTQNPKKMRPQPPVERGWADKADRRPPLRGPGGWGGDWYLWHAPEGLRARAATALGCMQAVPRSWVS